MATTKGVHDGLPKGYFEKNIARLKEFQLWFYMLSRVLMLTAGHVLAGFYLFDAWYFHSVTGVENKYVTVTAVIFLANGLRKLILRVIQMNDKLNTIQVKEDHHDPLENRWIRRISFVPYGMRRGLVGAIALATETFFVAHMLFAWIAVGINNDLFVLSGQFPFMFKPVSLHDWSFPQNSLYALGIALGALGLSWLNHSIFVLRYPKVRNAALGVASQVAGLIKGPLGGAASKLLELAQKVDAEVDKEAHGELTKQLDALIEAHLQRCKGDNDKT